MNSVSNTAANQKVFSIIIATSNCGEKIERTLQSIFAQNKELFEVIILDNASAPETIRYLEKYKNDLTLISEKDQGIYDAFNKGIKLAAGKYIYFIGAGDTLRPEILEKVKDFLPLDKPSVVYGRCYLMKAEKEYGREFTALRFFRDCLCQQGIFYHQEVFEIIGNYNLKYKVFADWLFDLKCFRNDKIKKQYLDLVIANYEGGGISEEIENDLAFKKDFPLIVKNEFGLFYYILCWLFLRERHLFNYIYELKIKALPWYLTTEYAPGWFRKLMTPVVHKYRSTKNIFYKAPNIKSSRQNFALSDKKSKPEN